MIPERCSKEPKPEEGSVSSGQEDKSATQLSLTDITQRNLVNSPITISCYKSVERGPALLRALKDNQYTNTELYKGGMKKMQYMNPTELKHDLGGRHVILIRDQRDSDEALGALERTRKVLHEAQISHELITSDRIAIIMNNLRLDPNNYF